MKPGLQIGQRGLMMGDRPQLRQRGPEKGRQTTAQAEGTGEGDGTDTEEKGR